MAEDVKNYTKSGRIQRPTYTKIAEWVLDSWKNIDTNLIRKSFKCCGISNERNGKDDHLIFNYDHLEQDAGTSNYVFDVENEIENSTNEVENTNNSEEDEYYETREISYENQWN